MTSQIEKATPSEVATEIVAENNPIVNFNAENLISQAIDKGLPVDTMERLLVMRRELKAEWAKEQFTKAMSAFQNECPTIKKTKSVPTKSGGIAYKYAPIESIVSQVKGLLEKHGFSYSTTMEVLPNGVKACVRVVHIAGHSEESCMQVPLGTQTQIMSASQQTAAAQTFAKRYAFCNAFGILTGDEDNDGAIVESGKVETLQPTYKAPVSKATEVNPTNTAKPASVAQINTIKKTMQTKGYKEIDLIDLGFGTLDKLTMGTASELIKYLFSAKTKEI